MNVPITMPQMGQSVAEGTIIRWVKKEGDAVCADDIILIIESDKISVEVGSPVAGAIGRCMKQEGEVVSVGEVIGEIIAHDLPAAPVGQHRPHADVSGDQKLVSKQTVSVGTSNVRLPEITRDWLSPYVMRLALQNDISLAELKEINGTGSEGRLTRNDVLHYLSKRPLVSGAPRTLNATSADLASLGEVRPMTSIRRTIADHMVQSIHTSAHVTMVHAVDMTSIVALRNNIKDTFLATYGFKMTYSAVLLFVTARVLREYPIINASVIGSNIVLHKDVNIGIAVALSDESLVVPVVKKADTKSFLEIARELERLISVSRNKALQREDVQDGTFTVSNFGAFGSLIGTPIIHQPQVAILGVGAIYKAPVVVDNQICIRDQVYLSFTFDHRVIDGAMGGRFLNAIQKQTESLTAENLNITKL
jgi:pyruvate/2-oxoglutarate dehydrogenase complex dihydrolipoamide acyltransferase (E2) component